MSTYEIPNEKSMLKICHSAFDGQFPEVFSQSAWKSDIILTSNREKNIPGKQQPLSSMGSSEYYKRFDYDAMANDILTDSSSERIVVRKKECLTDSDLDKLEEKLYKNISVELIVNDGSFSSLDSNIKYLRTTIQQVFDNFHKTMKDFELYKQKFNEIIAKNREDTVAEMEDFITDMIQHIMYSESNLNNGDDGSKTTLDKKEINLSNSEKLENNSERNTNLKAANSNCTLDCCKSDNNLTYTMPAEDAKLQQNKTVSVINVFLLSNQSYDEVKTINRNLFSEINITDTSEREDMKAETASAENLKKVAEKKLELENYERSNHDCSNNGIQRNFPVKESRAKQNIYINEDFVHDEDKGDIKSFISKICNYLCKKIRKNTFG